MNDDDSEGETEGESGSDEDDDNKDEGSVPGDDAVATPGGETGETVGEVTVPVPDDSKSSDETASPLEWIELLGDKGEEVTLGLRVYTQTKDEPAVITGRIQLSGEVWEFVDAYEDDDEA